MRLGGSDCERLVAGVLAQPVNALSSGAFVAAAGLVLAIAMRVTGRLRVHLTVFAATLAGVGVGSFAYHGPQPVWAGAAHDVSIVVALVCAAVWATQPVARRRIRRTGAGWLTVALVATALVAYAAGRTGSPLCDPGSRLQPHALWHILAAGAAYTLTRAAAGPTRRSTRTRQRPPR